MSPGPDPPLHWVAVGFAVCTALRFALLKGRRVHIEVPLSSALSSQYPELPCHLPHVMSLWFTSPRLGFHDRSLQGSLMMSEWSLS